LTGDRSSVALTWFPIKNCRHWYLLCSWVCGLCGWSSEVQWRQRSALLCLRLCAVVQPGTSYTVQSDGTQHTSHTEACSWSGSCPWADKSHWLNLKPCRSASCFTRWLTHYHPIMPIILRPRAAVYLLMFFMVLFIYQMTLCGFFGHPSRLLGLLTILTISYQLLFNSLTSTSTAV